MIFKLEEMAEFQKGFAFKSRDFKESGIKIVKVSNLTDESIDGNGCVHIDNELADNYKQYELKSHDIIITTVGSWPTNPASVVGKVVRVPKQMKGSLLNQNAVRVRSNENVDQRYLFYLLKSNFFKDYIIGTAQGSANQASITQKDIKNFKYDIHEFEEQKSIADILSALDEKIEINNKINKTLEEMAQAIFKQWFVDFEFPNEEGEPYKSSGGELVESEIGMIPKEWEVRVLGDIIELFDSKRIPLSKNEREKREKIYPYYGAASLMDFVDDYIFDGIYILMGEDGTVVDDYGFPILQYVWGKFWVNNHAHVIKGKGDISDEFIYILLKNTNVSSIVTGAVQPKINQQNLKGLKIAMPRDNKLTVDYSNIVKKSFEKVRCNSDEINILINMRELLLPKLMSGEIRVPVDSDEE
ncbi:hypothetical protein CBU02nite_26270 [Clostridium butyricum]|jgi:type I restriction enzyme S subunit|uniref:Type I restriction modification DNA specificity domain-containing protein n=1 Tax=Clostridium butyricum TaxID=1492 RepID=A0A512TPY8_CLOBU|nr:restriction endonuclease subunit S [Clostridium butyricum]NOW24906.1 type I restriction enzyme S subunit [Clostridium butyricum]GEQ22121.1 hypothetical protein CBU02nite_26270 [Clostridium butyricum]